MQSHLTGVGVHGDVGGAAGLERRLEEPRASSHIQHERSRERMPGVDLPGGIGGQRPIEAIRIGLLDEEVGEQPTRARHGGAPGAHLRHRLRHRVTVPHPRHGFLHYGVPVRIAWLNWRDTANPEGGGSEVYLERIATLLAERGHEVTVVCAAHDRAPGDELRAGVRFVRRGSKLGVYGQARRLLRSGDLGPIDVVVDTQNGIPFFAPWATRAPVLVLVHHVHREQWPVVYDPVRSRAGWFLESRIAPWAYRRQRYVAVSDRTREELVELGVDRRRISVVHNGTDTLGPESTFEDLMRQRAPRPTIAVLGRLVPHKRVEHVLKAAASLRASIPDLKVEVIGDGWWADRLVDAASEFDVDDLVTFHGHVDEARKDDLLRQAWVLALPSLKEGWGLVVMEAAARGVPAVAYARAGGVAESIRSDRTGVLVDGEEEDEYGGINGFTEALRRVLTDTGFRENLGRSALAHAHDYDWKASTDAFEEVLRQVTGERPNSQREGVDQFVDP